jgi:Fe-S-cluster containining protein
MIAFCGITMEFIDDRAGGEHLFSRAAGLLVGARDRAGLARAVAEFCASAEALAATGRREQTACRAGCPYCCVLNVTVLLPEAAAIAERLAGNLSVAALADLIDRLDYQRMRVRWLEDDERVRCRINCPFLDTAGNCTIHPFRPLMCRGITSLDSDLCREALDPVDPDASRSVPMDLVLKSAMDEAFCALARAAEGRGMDARGIELSAGVDAFLSRPELADLLLAGERLPDGLWE